jgi:hypothetical protein
MELLRESHLIILCRGSGWPEEIRAMLSGFGDRLLLAPGAVQRGLAALSETEWNDPAALQRDVENTLLGARRKDATS